LGVRTDTPLDKLPRRKTDNAHILQAGKREFRFKTQPLEPVTFKRYLYHTLQRTHAHAPHTHTHAHTAQHMSS
jgi:hypothetical protein